MSANSKRYECTSITVTSTVDGGSNPIDELIVKNMRKRFLITIQDTHVLVTSVSPDSSDSKKIFKFIKPNEYRLNLFALYRSAGSLGTLFLLGEEASLTHQTTSQVTVWQLNCQN